jgi:hypothetical protein
MTVGLYQGVPTPSVHPPMDCKPSYQHRAARKKVLTHENCRCELAGLHYVNTTTAAAAASQYSAFF